MQGIKLALVAALAAVSMGGAQAQQDYVKVTAELEPNRVTLSRADFTGRAAWRFLVRNGGGGGLNTDTLVVRTTAGTFDPTISIAPSKLATCTPDETTAQVLTCTFSTTGLYVGETSEFIVVVAAPVAAPVAVPIADAAFIELSWSRGGSEFVKVQSVADLIDGTSDDSVKAHLRSFMVASDNNKAYTGTIGGPATLADPWKTFADLGKLFTVDGKPQTYTQLTINEEESPSSCSAIQNNACWSSKLDIPKTKWTVASPLKIELQRHSSIIKNGAKLRNYFIQYKATDASEPVTLGQCSDTNPLAEGQPCLDGPCVEIALPTSPPTYIWSCKVKALDNGKYNVT